MASLFLVVSEPISWIVWTVLASVAVLGLVALVSPERFALLARGSSKWIDTEGIRERVERPIDIDQFVFRNSRVFGVLVVAAAGVLGYVYYVQ